MQQAALLMSLVGFSAQIFQECCSALDYLTLNLIRGKDKRINNGCFVVIPVINII